MPHKPPPEPLKIKGLPKIDPWRAPLWDLADAAAFQALARGSASSDQQIRALKFLVETLSGYYEISFHPGPAGDRVTAFAEGKRFVGQQVAKLIAMNLGAFKDKPSEQG